MPLAVLAEIRSRANIVGAVSLPAIGDVVTARRYRNGTVIVIAVVVIAVARSIAVTVAVIVAERAANHDTWQEPTATMPMMTVIAAISAAAISSLAKPRAGWAAADIASAAKFRAEPGAAPADTSAAQAATAATDGDATSSSTATAAKSRAKAGSTTA